MTPKVAKRGGSFKGAAAYYLHDKNAATSRRVAFCVTRNLPTEEPELAWRWMAYTDRHAGILKHDAGAAATGPKTRKPVYTLSLSWDPKEKKPAPDAMVQAMESALKKIGLSKCQALLVTHNDTDHPHIHAIVSLVDPDTGKIVDPGRDRSKLSAWAQSYETAQGQIRCHRRIENNARRAKGEWVVDRHSKTRQDIEQAKLIEREILAGRRRAQWDRQVADRDALKQQAEQRSETIRAELKERFKPQWAAFYKKQRQDARDVKNARHSVLAAMRVAIKERRRLAPGGRAGFGTILAYTISTRALTDALIAAQQRELTALRDAMNDARRAAVKAVWDNYGRDHRALKEAQAVQRAELRDREPGQQDARPAKAARPAQERGPSRRDATRPEPERPAPARPEAEGPPAEAPAGRRGSVRLELPTSGDSAEALSPGERAHDEERRRKELKAQFRRQAEEIARRRRERKHKDRDRDRER